MRSLLIITTILCFTAKLNAQDSELEREPSIQSPIEAFYGEEMFVAFHEVDGIKKEHKPSDFYLFNHNGDFHSSLYGVKESSSWNYDPEKELIKIYLKEGATIEYAIEGIQDSQIDLVNENEYLRIYIPENEEEVKVLKSTNSQQEQTAPVETTRIKSPLEPFYDKKLNIIEDRANDFDIAHDGVDYYFFGAEGTYEMLYTGNTASGTWVYYPETKAIGILLEGIELYSFEILDKNTVRISNKDRLMTLSILPLRNE